MKTKSWAIITMIICTLATSSAQLLYKQGLIQETIIKTALLIFFGLALYGMGAALLTIALKGGELSVLYPIIAMSYVFVNIGSMIFFNENLTILKWAGVIVILIGVSLVGYGGSKE